MSFRIRAFDVAFTATITVNRAYESTKNGAVPFLNVKLVAVVIIIIVIVKETVAARVIGL